MSPDRKPVIPPPSSSSSDAKINVLVRAQTGGELIFKVKLSTQFSKVASAFCKARGVDVKTVRFLSDRGQRLMGESTIEQVCFATGGRRRRRRRRRGGIS
ncbi:hypothetical protein K440DRAFT_317911 [Wilcoxina mikolae CBS 423.85]|nr:hypothetical protein K440DRAFT_317911 [Wilcoxina mikolae CBS 423.85]